MIIKVASVANKILKKIMNKDQANLKDYEIVETADGSMSYFSHKYQELCHSSSGAYSETLAYYIQGCQIIPRLFDHDEFGILEVGFGTGLGVTTLSEEIKKSFKSSKPVKIKFISLEEDRNLIIYFFSKNSLTFQNKTQDIYYCELFPLENVSIELIIICGDARTKAPPLIPRQFAHAIFQDAFSIKKNPTLWTVEWFEDLYQLASDTCLLSTYCASSIARRSMKLANWEWKVSDGFGIKKSSTLALKKKSNKVLIEDQKKELEEFENLAIKNNGFILRDKTIDDYLSKNKLS